MFIGEKQLWSAGGSPGMERGRLARSDGRGLRTRTAFGVRELTNDE